MVNGIEDRHRELSNIKKIIKLVCETSKDTKLCFSSIICTTDIKDIDGKINETNSHLENYCKQQNFGFFNENYCVGETFYRICLLNVC